MPTGQISNARHNFSLVNSRDIFVVLLVYHMSVYYFVFLLKKTKFPNVGQMFAFLSLPLYGFLSPAYEVGVRDIVITMSGHVACVCASAFRFQTISGKPLAGVAGSAY